MPQARALQRWSGCNAPVVSALRLAADSQSTNTLLNLCTIGQHLKPSEPRDGGQR